MSEFGIVIMVISFGILIVWVKERIGVVSDNLDYHIQCERREHSELRRILATISYESMSDHRDETVVSGPLEEKEGEGDEPS
jgi:hypothetical protein